MQDRRNRHAGILDITIGGDKKSDRKHSQVGRTGKRNKQRDESKDI